jgi:beta-1,4-N-acetylglucosaminyltransferase
VKIKAVILVYGEGGHKAQMQRLHKLMSDSTKNKGVTYIGICENSNTINQLSDNYTLRPLRDKYSNFTTIAQLPGSVLDYIKIFNDLNKKYDILSVVSTGPGISIPISIYFKILGKKIVFIETWSRFEGKSISGKIMYKIADKFYIQNKSLHKLYPNAIYGGLL